MRHITLADFAEYFTVSTENIPERVAADLTYIDTLHRDANKEELEEYIDYFIKKATKSTAKRSDEENLDIFERGWAENLESIQQEFSLTTCRPKYFQNMPPYYLGPDGRMYFCKNRELCVDMLALYVKYLFLTFFADFECIHEFGSGSGQNLLTMISVSSPFHKKLVGYEWTNSGVKLADMIGEKTGYDVKGCRFDMLNPDYSVDIQGQAVFTMASVEQLADRTDAFLDFLLTRKPGVVVHIEPDSSLKAGDSMYSHLSDLYLTLRGYSRNYYQNLKRQEAAGRLTIKHAFSLPWLTNFHNVICSIWSPL